VSLTLLLLADVSSSGGQHYQCVATNIAFQFVGTLRCTQPGTVVTRNETKFLLDDEGFSLAVVAVAGTPRRPTDATRRYQQLQSIAQHITDITASFIPRFESDHWFVVSETLDNYEIFKQNCCFALGTLPNFDSTSLILLDVSNNKFSGVVGSLPSTLSYLDLSRNE
jgi:hypothetical protein